VLFSGWYLFLFYVGVAVTLIVTIVGWVFIPKLLQLSVFVFDPIGFEMVSNRKTLPIGQTLSWRHDPHHPFLILVNIVWFVFLGWIFFLVHLFSGLIQLLTVVGVGNAITNGKIAIAMLAPFGKSIQRVPTPPKPVRSSPPSQNTVSAPQNMV
jgi:uncharacterized membrane protein YccF (DUF307 family)